MHCFEILIADTAISKDGGPFVPDDRLTYGIPNDAGHLLGPILSPYKQNPMRFFEKLNFGRPPAPWALACLDREYAIAGHIATSRNPDSGISFSPYSQVPDPVPEFFVPGVGVLVFSNKKGLELSAEKSPLFAAAWSALRECSPDKRWLVILDKPSETWLEEVLRGDSERWLSR